MTITLTQYATERKGHGEFVPAPRDISTLVPAGKMVTLDTADGLIERASKHEMVIDYSPEAMRIRDLIISYRKLRPFLRVCPTMVYPYPTGRLLGIKGIRDARELSYCADTEPDENPQRPMLFCRTNRDQVEAMLVANAQARFDNHDDTIAAIIWSPFNPQLPQPTLRQFLDAHGVEQVSNENPKPF
jgi:hypothetical protein